MVQSPDPNLVNIDSGAWKCIYLKKPLFPCSKDKVKES